MKFKTIIIGTVITIFFILICPISIAQDINVETHNIEISKDTNQIFISESLQIKGDSDGYYETILFWIQNDNTNLEIIVDDKEPNSVNSVDQNLFECNVSGLNILINKSVQVNIKYNLPGNTSNFQKKITNNTNEITIKYNGEEFKANDVLIDTFFTINLLLKKSTTIVVSSDDTVYLAIIAILIIIILLILFISRKKSKTSAPSKKTELKTSSEELLSTKKTLLMELLKDVEKKHRSKEISDDTYHKLKDYYKQEAVEAMKQLEDMKLKVR